MDIQIQKSFARNPLEALRRAGYFPFRDPQTGSESFVCRLGPDFYPRFHLYLKDTSDGVIFSLHLDQKQASYAGSNHMHNGEYEGTHIEKELERIRGWVMHLYNEATSVENDRLYQKEEKKASWWKFWK